ncbi:hypothetical protein [Leptolyngbya sp. NK1-12]|uniref:hypothetical protein n=1 Tax=Leptolyngbya sp. NK1-12 TaxID=2547451 RepID=UPI0029300717|nr:hypothetical protein [Leptolyngbya sp. NK1-12]
MVSKLILGAIWIGFTAYTLWIAPLDRPYTWFVGKQLLSFNWTALNAFIPAIFWLMGIWSMIYGCLMFADGRMQRFRAWPYFLGSNFTGVMCLLPYLILRQSNQEFHGKFDPVLRFFERQATGFAMLLITLGLIAYALIAGDWQDYLQQFQTRAFVHLISLDFCCMALILPVTSLLKDDMARRGWSHRPMIFWSVALVPLFGPLLYLCFRPPLIRSNTTEYSQENSQQSATPDHSSTSLLL